MTAENNAFTFTHSRLEAIKPPKAGRNSYRDVKVAGLTFVITANDSKSFYFYKRIHHAFASAAILKSALMMLAKKPRSLAVKLPKVRTRLRLAARTRLLLQRLRSCSITGSQPTARFIRNRGLKMYGCSINTAFHFIKKRLQA